MALRPNFSQNFSINFRYPSESRKDRETLCRRTLFKHRRDRCKGAQPGQGDEAPTSANPNGFTQIRCDECGHLYMPAFSCKRRHYCPSCRQKRAVAFDEWLCDKRRQDRCEPASGLRRPHNTAAVFPARPQVALLAEPLRVGGDQRISADRIVEVGVGAATKSESLFPKRLGQRREG